MSVHYFVHYLNHVAVFSRKNKILSNYFSSSNSEPVLDIKMVSSKEAWIFAGLFTDISISSTYVSQAPRAVPGIRVLPE